MRRFLLGVFVVAACLDPTEFEIKLETDLRCPDDPPSMKPTLERTVLEIFTPSGWEQVAETKKCSAGKVGNIFFVPNGSHKEVRVRARGIGRSPEAIDRREARIGVRQRAVPDGSNVHRRHVNGAADRRWHGRRTG